MYVVLLQRGVGDNAIIYAEYIRKLEGLYEYVMHLQLICGGRYSIIFARKERSGNRKQKLSMLQTAGKIKLKMPSFGAHHRSVSCDICTDPVNHTEGFITVLCSHIWCRPGKIRYVTICLYIPLLPV